MKWCYFMLIVVIRWRNIHCLVICMQNRVRKPQTFSRHRALFVYMWSAFYVQSICLNTVDALCFSLALCFSTIHKKYVIYYLGDVHLRLKKTINWMRVWIILFKLRLFFNQFFFSFSLFVVYCFGIQGMCVFACIFKTRLPLFKISNLRTI